MPRVRAKARQGFTLAELLLALIFLTAVLIPLLASISSILVASGDTEHNMVAVNLAQAKMEEIKNTAFDSIVDESKSAVSGHPTYKQEVITSDPETGLRNVKVVVYWETSTGSENNLDLETLISK